MSTMSLHFTWKMHLTYACFFSRTKLHAVQERIAKSHGSQCGFCTPGIVMSMYTLLRNNPKPEMEDIETYFQVSTLNGVNLFDAPQTIFTIRNMKWSILMSDSLRRTWPPRAQIFQTWPRRWRSRNLDLKSDRRRDVIASSIEWEIIYSYTFTSHMECLIVKTFSNCARWWIIIASWIIILLVRHFIQ